MRSADGPDALGDGASEDVEILSTDVSEFSATADKQRARLAAVSLALVVVRFLN